MSTFRWSCFPTSSGWKARSAADWEDSPWGQRGGGRGRGEGRDSRGGRGGGYKGKERISAKYGREGLSARKVGTDMWVRVSDQKGLLFF